MGERSWARFAACVVLGAVAAFTLLVFPTLGLLLFVVAAWVVRLPRLRSSAWGILAGVGAISLVIAFVNRRGQNADPRPWLVAGIVFVVSGVALQVRAIRRSSRPAPSPR